MAHRIAILCPGQGGQHARMFDFARDGHVDVASIAGAALAAAAENRDLLFSNRIAQPIIVAAAIANWHAIRERIPAPSLVAGYSIGELSAYAIAGAVAEHDAVALASRRAEAMDDCGRSGPPQLLMSVSGLRLAQLDALLPPARAYIAIETGEDSAIVGGEAEPLRMLGERLHQLGARTSELPVEVASHTPCMRKAAERFLLDLRQYPFTCPEVPVLSGITASRQSNAEDARTTLASQIAQKIRWMDCMDAWAEAGVTIAIELGPGNALARMLAARHPHIACRSTDDFRTVGGFVKWIENQLG